MTCLAQVHRLFADRLIGTHYKGPVISYGQGGYTMIGGASFTTTNKRGGGGGRVLAILKGDRGG